MRSTFYFLNKNSKYVFVVYLLAWGIVGFVLPREIFIKNLQLTDIINRGNSLLDILGNPDFWSTWLGIVLRVGIEVLLVSFIIFLACMLLKYFVSFCITIIAAIKE